MASPRRAVRNPGVTRRPALAVRLGGGASALLAALLFSTHHPGALAQEPAPLTRVDKATAKVVIKSIDKAARRITVTNAAGEDFTIKVPAEARNFDAMKVGDRINATYVLETEIVISPPNADVPPDSAATLTARAAEGEQPAGLIANYIVVTGTVTAIDMASHTLKIVSPQGGQVHTVVVKRPEGRKAMERLKIGDRITARITESLLIAADPA